MKKLVIVLLVTSAFFTGCKKEEKYCWSCITTTHYIRWANEYREKSEICDKTEKEIRALEQEAQNTTTDDEITTMKCTNSSSPGYETKCGTHNGRTLYKGPEGGCYYINSNGNKTYVDRKKCNC